MLIEALTLQLGYNATLVTLGSAAIGIAAGASGTYLMLRKRALVSDAVSHATLPGLALAFLAMVALGFEGRSLPGLMLGSALSAGIGLLAVSWMTRRTRLPEDAAIGAVLSVFFGFGIVLLTVIQNLDSGRQAGLEGFLLGATAGMLRSEAILIAVGGGLVLLLTVLMRRPLTLTAFDPEYAETQGVSPGRMDLVIMLLVMAVTVIGLKVVGLILIVALLIIPPVTARFWSNRAERVALLGAIFGGIAGYTGAAISALAPNLPTGPIIVLISFGLFAFSMLASPLRGVLAAWLRHRSFQRLVHRRQGLMALAQGQPVYERLTQRILRRDGLMRADGVATDEGRAMAANILRDEARWRAVRHSKSLADLTVRDDGLTSVDAVLTTDQIAEIDRRLGAFREATP